MSYYPNERLITFNYDSSFICEFMPERINLISNINYTIMIITDNYLLTFSCEQLDQVNLSHAPLYYYFVLRFIGLFILCVSYRNVLLLGYLFCVYPIERSFYLAIYFVYPIGNFFYLTIF